jgi:hypothetical protein
MLRKFEFIWKIIMTIFLLIIVPLNRIFSLGILQGDNIYQQAEIPVLIFIIVSIVLRILSRKSNNKDKL